VSGIADLAKIADGLAFGIPGGGASLEVADAVERQGGRFHTTRFEGSAALMAGAVGRLRGSPGVAVSIKGPGLANLAAGLATAWLEDLPVVAIAEAFGKSEVAARMHKRLDHSTLVGAITKGRCGIDDSAGVARLASLAAAERPGPVLIELSDTASYFPPSAALAPRDTDAVLRAIEGAQRPVVVAGGLAARRGLSDALNSLSVPVFSTAGAKGVVDETRPYAAGVYTGVGRELAPEHAIIADADLVVGIGLRTHEVLAAGLPVPFINVDDLDAAPGFSLSAVAPIDAAPRILAGLRESANWGRSEIAGSRDRMRTALLDGPFLPAQVFAALAEQLPRCSMVLDTGFFCTIGEHIWEVSAPELYLSSGQGRSMGAALPMAVAAALYRPEVPTVLAIGDGGIGMFMTELTLAVTERLPLLVLFLSDGTYASVRDRAVWRGLAQRPLISPDLNWIEIASGMGFAADRVATAADVSRFVQRWNGAGPAFLDVRFDPEPYRTMTTKLRA